jgi:hypothetical protein
MVVQSIFFRPRSAGCSGWKASRVDLGLPDGPCEPLPARRTYPVIASMSFSTPTMLSTRVRL